MGSNRCTAIWVFNDFGSLTKIAGKSNELPIGWVARS